MKKVKKVYLAGKVSKKGEYYAWRNKLFPNSDLVDQMQEGNLYSEQYPLIIFDSFQYMGPFFMSNISHGIYGESHTHGVDRGNDGLRLNDQSNIALRCMNAIEQSDYIFAWIDSLDAYGTYAEIGYAAAKNKKIFLGTTRDCDKEAWFPNVIAGIQGLWGTYETVEEAWNNFKQWSKLESRLEELMYPALHFWCNDMEYELLVQEPIDKYRVDFSVKARGKNFVIECDGHDYHERTKEQARRDKERDRKLMALGYETIRFTGSEVYEDSYKCVREAMKIIVSKVETEKVDLDNAYQ